MASTLAAEMADGRTPAQAAAAALAASSNVPSSSAASSSVAAVPSGLAELTAAAAAASGGLGAADWACVRGEAFPPDVGRNAYRHLRLHDYSDNVSSLPRWRGCMHGDMHGGECMGGMLGGPMCVRAMHGGGGGGAVHAWGACMGDPCVRAMHYHYGHAR